MKYPKNRGNLYIVIREIPQERTAFIGSFSDLVEADNFKDACAAEWFDRTKGMVADFKVVITTYYG